MKKIFVVGIGPGGKEYLTLRAREAILKCDVIVGYTPYLKYVEDLTPGKEIISTGMMGEIKRCEAAVNEAKKGKKVAIVSTGDAGLYGMASPICQLLEDEKDIELEVIPGVTAAFAAASISGAPLTHDTALISLSDLLTPMDKILKRVKGAAQADFVICLYNPKSKRRIDPFTETVNILINEYGMERICIIVKNALREGESIKFTTTGKLQNEDIDMNTVIIVGNSTTYLKNDRAVTPRGYGI